VGFTGKRKRPNTGFVNQRGGGEKEKAHSWLEGKESGLQKKKKHPQWRKGVQEGAKGGGGAAEREVQIGGVLWNEKKKP